MLHHARHGRSLSTTPDFGPRTLAFHWHTTPPAPEQLHHANRFFTQRPPELLWSSPRLVTMPLDQSPEVCLFGRSNVGKSSLLNALLGQKIAYTSSKPGRTRSMNAFSIGKSADPAQRLVLLDMPGYGRGGQAAWGAEILKYLEKRRQLKRAFVLIDIHHGVKDTDVQLLDLLVQHQVPHQLLLSKVDKKLCVGSKLPRPEQFDARVQELTATMMQLRRVVEPPEGNVTETLAIGEVLACSAEMSHAGKKLGIDAVRFAMLRAAGLHAPASVRAPSASNEEIVSFEDLEKLCEKGK